MSALDRAFIKAYAKDTPAAESPPQVAAMPPAAIRGRAAPRARQLLSASAPAPADAAHVIEQVYQGGALYRVEAPAARQQPIAVPAPHFQLPPRSSPRRNVRRSLLKLFEAPDEPQSPPTPESASIRRPARASAAPFARPVLAPLAQELSPEDFHVAPHEEPLPLKATPNFDSTLPQSSPPPAETPLNAPLNQAVQLGSSVEIQGHWDDHALSADAALVVAPEPADLQLTQPPPLVELRLDSLPIAPDSPLAERADHSTLASATFRLDSPHAELPARPHFPAIPESTGRDSQQSPGSDFGAGDRQSFADLDPAAADDVIAAATHTGEAELEFFAPDALTEQEQRSLTEAGDQTEPTAAPPKCVPVWEVDRFQWPVTVERLIAAKGGYFAQAGERLVAAVHDGLRTLAVTGSRRGEGRTTLALCLARAAAQAGIQVAVVDADFARPQLAARIGLEITHGWQDAATGAIPLSEAAVRSLSDEMTVLPLEAASAAGQLSLADPRVTATLRAAAATFELVIVDLGPLAAADDELFPADEACPFDAAIVVRDLRYASVAESDAVGERLYAAGIEAVGVAENFVVHEEITDTST